MNSGPVGRGICRTDLAGKFADKDFILRHEPVFEIRLIGDDVTGARINKHYWPIQRYTPALTDVAIRGLLELTKILGCEFSVDTGGLRRHTDNEHKQARDDQ